jgi:putative membrane protein
MEHALKNIQITIIAAVVAAVALAPSIVLAQAGSGWHGPHMWRDGGWPGMIFGPLFMVLVLALVIGGAVLLVRWLAGPGSGTAPHQPPPRSALDILRERYARGEIDKEEFEERRRVLGE